MSTKAAKVRSREHGFHSFEEAIDLAIDRAANALEYGTRLPIPTGISALDDKIGGLHRSHLAIIAGSVGVGKTSLATNIAYNIASSYERQIYSDNSSKTIKGGIVGFYSLMASAEELATRIISEQTKIPLSRIQHGDISDADFETLVACSQEMQKIPFYIDQTGSISVAQLAARARRLKRQRGLDVLVIDYLQLLFRRHTEVSDDEPAETSRIINELKSLAREIDVSILVVFDTYEVGTSKYSEQMRFLHTEINRGTVDFVTIIGKQWKEDATGISFLDAAQVGSDQVVFGDSVEDSEVLSIDFHEYISNKIKDWDKSIRRIDENLNRFKSVKER